MNERYKQVQATFCQYMDTPERRVLDLSNDGIPEIPVLGLNRSVHVRAGACLHRHENTLEFTHCLRGSVKFDCNGKVYNLHPGDIFLTTPSDAHRLRRNTQGSVVEWIFFRLPKRECRFAGLGKAESAWLFERLLTIPSHLFDGSNAIASAFTCLFSAYDELPRGGLERTFRMRKGALDLLVALADAGHRQQKKNVNKELTFVIERMRRKPEAEFDMDELVQATMLSPSTIVNRFKTLTGWPPHAFLLKCRIHAAQRLLAGTSEPVTAIAESLGFSSSQHFATRFKQETGMKPQEWRSGMFKKS